MTNSWWFLISLAFILGLRHGLDLDHIATIDSLTRTVYDNKLLSKLVGFLFSLGHGLIVIIVSLVIGSGIVKAQHPHWLPAVGNWISIIFLFIFSILNFYNILKKPSQLLPPVGIKSFLAKRIATKTRNPFFIILVGALFAVSFDTFTQVALFSISASLVAGLLFSGLLGFVFMLGMMSTDGLNGMLVSLLIQRVDVASINLSRLLGLLIATFSFVIGIFGLKETILS